jgi:putative nucleotidyltransferase with HDIG domain
MVETLVPSESPPQEAILEGHCNRVGAIANLIAHHLFLTTEEKGLLHAASLLLHRHATSGAAADVRAVLAAFGRPGLGNPLHRQLGAILRLCDAFDREFQAQPFHHKDAPEILAGLRRGVDQGMWPRKTLDALEECTKPQVMPEPSTWRVPVFPQAALQTLNTLRDPAASIPHVVDAARRDPATAGAIVQLANSALFADLEEVSALHVAVARLGFDIARKVVASLAMRPLLFLPKLEILWPHSIEVADLAEQLAGRARGVDSGEAYLAGLLHDVGRIALLASSLYDSARMQGLVQSGCPAVYAEGLILRTDHAVVGGLIAAKWRLPGHLVRAIRQHHRPETATSPLAYLLYLAEHLAGAQEDLPSSLRLEMALDGLGLTAADLDRCAPSQLGSWLAAA